MSTRAVFRGMVESVAEDSRGAVFVICDDTDDPQHPRKVAFRFWSRKVAAEANGAKGGDYVSITWRPSSREYQGKWYTELEGFAIEVLEPKQAAEQSEAY